MAPRTSGTNRTGTPSSDPETELPAQPATDPAATPEVTSNDNRLIDP